MDFVYSPPAEDKAYGVNAVCGFGTRQAALGSNIRLPIEKSNARFGDYPPGASRHPLAGEKPNNSSYLARCSILRMTLGFVWPAETSSSHPDHGSSDSVTRFAKPQADGDQQSTTEVRSERGEWTSAWFTGTNAGDVEEFSAPA